MDWVSLEVERADGLGIVGDCLEEDCALGGVADFIACDWGVLDYERAGIEAWKVVAAYICVGVGIIEYEGYAGVEGEKEEKGCC